MDRETEVEIINIALLMLMEAGEQQDKGEFAVLVPRRALVALADAFRKGGVDPRFPNVQKEGT